MRVCACGKEHSRNGPECWGCYMRRRRRENPEVAERDRAAARTWKDRNREVKRAHDRAYSLSLRVPCPNGCGALCGPDSVACAGCRNRAAQARAATIIRLYGEGVPLRAIAAALGTTVNAINGDLDRLCKAGRIGRRRPYTRRAAA